MRQHSPLSSVASSERPSPLYSTPNTEDPRNRGTPAAALAFMYVSDTGC
jgi:hypothetical protein